MKRVVLVLVTVIIAVLCLASNHVGAATGPTVKTVTARHVTHDGVYRELITTIRAAWRPAGHGDGIDRTPTVTVLRHHGRRNNVYCRTTQGKRGFGDRGNNWTDTLRFRYDDVDNLPTPCTGPAGFTVVAHVKLDADGASHVTWKDYSNDPGNPVGTVKHATLTDATVSPFDLRGHGGGPIGLCYWRNFTYYIAGNTIVEGAWMCPNGSKLVGGVLWDNSQRTAGPGYFMCSGPTATTVHVRWKRGIESSSWKGDWFIGVKGVKCSDDKGVHARMAMTVYGNGNWAYHFWAFTTTGHVTARRPFNLVGQASSVVVG